MSDKVEGMAEAHADFIKRWYKDVFMHGFKHGVESVTPPSPPAKHSCVTVEECADCHHGFDLHENETGECTIVDCDCLKFKPPAEVPEVEPWVSRVHDAPLIYGECQKWYRAIGKKPANSCVGCTIPGCKVKGKVDDRKSDVPLGPPDDEPHKAESR